MGVAKVAVIGCGMMGRGIVEVAAVKVAAITTEARVHATNTASAKSLAALGELYERALMRLREDVGSVRNSIAERTFAWWFQSTNDLVSMDFAMAAPGGMLIHCPTAWWSERLPDEPQTPLAGPPDALSLRGQPTRPIPRSGGGPDPLDRSTKWALLSSGVALHGAGMVSGICNGSAALALVFVSMGATVLALALVGGLHPDRGRIVRDILRGRSHSTKQNKRSNS